MQAQCSHRTGGSDGCRVKGLGFGVVGTWASRPTRRRVPTLTRHCVRALVLQVRQAKLRMPSWENVEEAINFTVLPKGSAGTEKPELFGTHSQTYSPWRLYMQNRLGR